MSEENPALSELAKTFLGADTQWLKGEDDDSARPFDIKRQKLLANPPQDLAHLDMRTVKQNGQTDFYAQLLTFLIFEKEFLLEDFSALDLDEARADQQAVVDIGVVFKALEDLATKGEEFQPSFLENILLGVQLKKTANVLSQMADRFEVLANDLSENSPKAKDNVQIIAGALRSMADDIEQIIEKGLNRDGPSPEVG